MAGNRTPVSDPVPKSPITLSPPDVPQADSRGPADPAKKADAPSPEGLLAKAAHSVAEFIKPTEAGEPSQLPGQPGDAAQVLDPSKEIDHNLPVTADVQVSEGGIEVVAVGLGFIDNQRKAIGDKFRVRDESLVGEWMQPTDKALAEKLAKKRAAKAEQGRKEAEERLAHRRSLLGF